MATPKTPSKLAARGTRACFASFRDSVVLLALSPDHRFFAVAGAGATLPPIGCACPPPPPAVVLLLLPLRGAGPLRPPRPRMRGTLGRTRRPLTRVPLHRAQGLSRTRGLPPRCLHVLTLSHPRLPLNLPIRRAEGLHSILPLRVWPRIADPPKSSR